MSKITSGRLYNQNIEFGGEVALQKPYTTVLSILEDDASRNALKMSLDISSNFNKLKKITNNNFVKITDLNSDLEKIRQEIRNIKTFLKGVQQKINDADVVEPIDNTTTV